MLILLSVFALLMLLPIKWAADFTDATNTSIPVCGLASILGPVLAVLVFRFMQGGFNGFMLAYLALVGTYVAILRVPSRSIIGFAIIVLALQIASAMALISFGFNIVKLLLGQ